MLADANVLYSRTLRDWLLGLQFNAGPYHVLWTEDILAEVLYRLRRKHPGWSGEQIVDVRKKLLLVAGEGRISSYTVDGNSPWQDVNDQHVHAAAVAGGAHYLLTNDNGFRDPSVDEDLLTYEIYRPDEFFVLVDDADPAAVLQTAQWQIAYYMRTSGEANLCEALKLADCPDFSERVRKHLVSLA